MGGTNASRWRGRMRLPQGRARSAAALVGGPGPGAQDQDAAAPPAGAAFPRAGRWGPAPRVAALLTLAAGVLNLGSALLPAKRQRLDLLHRLVPGPSPGVRRRWRGLPRYTRATRQCSTSTGSRWRGERFGSPGRAGTGPAAPGSLRWPATRAISTRTA
jgi:hypothetical protein